MPRVITKRVPNSLTIDYQLISIYQHWNFVQFSNVFPEMGPQYDLGIRHWALGIGAKTHEENFEL